MIPQQVLSGEVRIAPTSNREQWLTNVAVLLRPWCSARGYEIPLRVRVGVGALSASRKTLGVCYADPDAGGFRHITISPFVDDPVLVAAILLHELIHAMFPAAELHGSRFAAAACALGLQRPVSQVVIGEPLRAFLEQVVRQVGPYPHRALALR